MIFYYYAHTFLIYEKYGSLTQLFMNEKKKLT